MTEECGRIILEVLHIVVDMNNDAIALEENRHIRAIDRVLLKFSDTASCTREVTKLLWKRNGPPPSVDQICEKYAPVNLKSQFEQVYKMLHPGLVSRDHKQNVSVFLEGRKLTTGQG